MLMLVGVSLLLMLTHTTESYDPYPYNPRIHTLGNHGILGKLHAEIAPIFIGVTDRIIYNENVRQRVIDQIGVNKSVLDIGCGVGISTSNSQGSMGIDTSKPMIEKARNLFPEKTFAVEHGEHWSGTKDFDVVTSMFCFHEIPRESRKKMIERCLNYAREQVIIVDISPNYQPNKSMLSGEPYLIDYLENICDDLVDFEETVLVNNHVHMWAITLHCE